MGGGVIDGARSRKSDQGAGFLPFAFCRECSRSRAQATDERPLGVSRAAAMARSRRAARRTYGQLGTRVACACGGKCRACQQTATRRGHSTSYRVQGLPYLSHPFLDSALARVVPGLLRGVIVWRNEERETHNLRRSGRGAQPRDSPKQRPPSSTKATEQGNAQHAHTGTTKRGAFCKVLLNLQVGYMHMTA